MARDQHGHELPPANTTQRYGQEIRLPDFLQNLMPEETPPPVEPPQKKLKKAEFAQVLHENPQLPDEPDDSYLSRIMDTAIPMFLRVGGAIGGGILGGLSAGPLGIIAGGAAGSGLGEGLAQTYETGRDLREDYNPQQIAMQSALGAIPLGIGKAGQLGLGAGKLAAKGMGHGGLSTVGTSLAETGEMPSVGEVVGGMALGGGMGYGMGRATQRFKDVPLGETPPDIANAIERNLAKMGGIQYAVPPGKRSGQTLLRQTPKNLKRMDELHPVEKAVTQKFGSGETSIKQQPGLVKTILGTKGTGQPKDNKVYNWMKDEGIEIKDGETIMEVGAGRWTSLVNEEPKDVYTALKNAGIDPKSYVPTVRGKTNLGGRPFASLKKQGDKHELIGSTWHELNKRFPKINYYASDPVNLPPEVNRAASRAVGGGRADKVLSSNVLNVIKEPKNRDVLIREMADYVKQDGAVLITVHKAAKAGQSKTGSWQNAKKLEQYKKEVAKWFDFVEIKDGTIIARFPKKNLLGYPE